MSGMVLAWISAADAVSQGFLHPVDKLEGFEVVLKLPGFDHLSLLVDP